MGRLGETPIRESETDRFKDNPAGRPRRTGCGT